MEEKKEKDVLFVIVTGLSGSGKSCAIKCLEDIGFFCVDNLPVALLPKFAELCLQTTRSLKRVALGIDIREGVFLKEFLGVLKHMRHMLDVRMWFLEADNKVLFRRFSESRRPHPLSDTGTVLEGIERERKTLSFIREQADRILDTSLLTVHELREIIEKNFVEGSQGKGMRITLTSFGYRYGLPYDADIVMDVRFLPNPYFIDDLRNLNGTDNKVKKYVLGLEDTKLFLNKLSDILEFLLPRYIREGKTYLTIAVGCTGGKHRSVAIIEWLRDFLCREGYEILSAKHKDIAKP